MTVTVTTTAPHSHEITLDPHELITTQLPLLTALAKARLTALADDVVARAMTRTGMDDDVFDIVDDITHADGCTNAASWEDVSMDRCFGACLTPEITAHTWIARRTRTAMASVIASATDGHLNILDDHTPEMIQASDFDDTVTDAYRAISYIDALGLFDEAITADEYEQATASLS